VVASECRAFFRQLIEWQLGRNLQQGATHAHK